MSNDFQRMPGKDNAVGENSMFELLLFRLGESRDGPRRELFGINIFKVREIMVMPEITHVVKAHPAVMGMADLRGQLVPIINLPMIVGCRPTKGLGILLITEFARTTQAFAVEEVDEIVRLDWKQALPPDASSDGLITSIARLDADIEKSRLAQVLDVEKILREVMPDLHAGQSSGPAPVGQLPPGTVVLAADDSAVARAMIGQGLQSMNIDYIMVNSGKEAWNRLTQMHEEALAQGQNITDRVAMVLTDLEMPEMDGFTLARNIKQDARFQMLPVLVHSSLSGTTTELHARRAGADGYVAKFVAHELGREIFKLIAASR